MRSITNKVDIINSYIKFMTILIGFANTYLRIACYETLSVFFIRLCDLKFNLYVCTDSERNSLFFFVIDFLHNMPIHWTLHYLNFSASRFLGFLYEFWHQNLYFLRILIILRQFYACFLQGVRNINAVMLRAYISD